ncbi:hypothetical protein [Cellulomonas composti]|uniref:Uncharacterized protein n=1 Tax=Cellulomonas composti TaxID=266130 RepID=A0A511J801_9CELL|nr:hypothetical protein [Cellulomonas composti]GEL94125.1 hypothetical protein CCO02nite_07830 [Cellulomonas composti]
MASPTLPALPWQTDADLRRRHLLALPADVEPDEVEVLAASRFGAARWEQETQPARGRPLTAAFGIRLPAAVPAATVLRLSRHTTLVGPYAVTAQDAAALGLPGATTQAYSVFCTRERGERPYPGGDRYGLKRAFPDGLPVREEERVMLWLVACARRLGGAVRVGESGGPLAVLVPDMESAIDLTVFAPGFVEPTETLTLVQRVLPRARLSAPEHSWTGPLPGAGRAPQDATAWSEPGGRGLRVALEQHGLRDPDERRRVLAESAAFDEMAALDPPAAESYGVVADLGVDGIVVVEVAEEPEPPTILRNLPWTEKGAVAYRVRWEPASIEDLELERPPLEHRVARTRVAPVVQAVARTLHAAVGGEIADEADFLVDPADV